MAQSPRRIRSLINQTAKRIANLQTLQRIRSRRLKAATTPAHPARREGLDYVSLPPREAKSLGAKFVMRYLSHTPAKNITASERRELHDLGIAVGLVWETSADRAKRGHAAGVADASEARAQASALGVPTSTAIHFAVDFDTAGAPGVVDGYFRGVLAELGKERAGVYGSYEVVKHLHEALGVRWLWQTYAWSRGHWYGPAQIQQYRNGDRYDRCRTTVSAAGLWEAPKK